MPLTFQPSQPLGCETIWITCSPAPSLCPCSSGVHICLCTLGHPDWAVRGSERFWGRGRGHSFPTQVPLGPLSPAGDGVGAAVGGGVLHPCSETYPEMGWVSLEGVYQLGLRAIHDCPEAVPALGVRASCRCTFIQGSPQGGGDAGAQRPVRLSWQGSEFSRQHPFVSPPARGHLGEGGARTQMSWAWELPRRLHTSAVTCFPSSSGQRTAAFPI